MIVRPHFPGVGSHWLSVTLTAVLILALAAWLLKALNEAQEMAEKTLVEVTVRNMRVGMQLAMGEAMMHGRVAQISGWGGANPSQWLGAAPEGYLGECSSDEADLLPSGRWCFDRERRELVYSPRNASHLRMLSESESKRLKWRVVATAVSEGDGQIGLRVENITPYEWFLD